MHSGESLEVSGTRDRPVLVDARQIGAGMYVCRGFVEGKNGGQWQIAEGFLWGTDLGTEKGGVFVSGSAGAELDRCPGESRQQSRVRIRRSRWTAYDRSTWETVDKPDTSAADCCRVLALNHSVGILRERATAELAEWAQLDARQDAKVIIDVRPYYGTVSARHHTSVRALGLGHRFTAELFDTARASIDVGDDGVSVNCHDQSTLAHVSGRVTVQTFDASSADVTTGATVTAHGASRVTARGKAKITLASDFTGELVEVGDQLTVRDLRRAIASR